MFLLKPTIFAIFAILVSVQADQSWYSFRTTFSLTGFPDRQPWLQSEAEDRGWVKVSDDCSEGARYRSIISLLLILVLFESTTDVLFICLGNRYDSTFKGIYIPFS